MNSLPAELKLQPRAVLALIGTTEANRFLCTLLQASNESNSREPTTHYINLPFDHQFPIKKEAKLARPATFVTRSERDFEDAFPEGILKSKWMMKHQTLLPSVVIPTFEFDPRLNANEWNLQETVITNEISRLRRVVSGRECKVVLILIQVADEVELERHAEERVVNLKRRLDLDSKTLVVLKQREIAAGAHAIIRLENLLRTYGLEYYRCQAKRVKRYKKQVSKSPTLMPLHVRHSFKIAHYYEFRQQPVKMLKHYNAAYKTLVTLPIIQGADDNNNTTTAAQDGSSTVTTENSIISLQEVKEVAGFINFKLCFHEIFSANNLGAAVEQFQLHMSVFANIVGHVDFSYEHWAWVSQQYEIFAELLEELSKRQNKINGHPSSSISAVGIDSSRYKEPYLYYSIAAKYGSWRRKAASKAGLCSTKSGVIPTLSENDFIIQPSIYWGAQPAVTLLKISGESGVSKPPAPTLEALCQYRQMKEYAVPHVQKAISLLEKAEQHLAVCFGLHSEIPTVVDRFRCKLAVQRGIEHLAAGECVAARSLLEKSKEFYAKERWWAIVAQCLKQLLLCAYKQADSSAFVDFSLQLLSPRLVTGGVIVDQARQRIYESMMQELYSLLPRLSSAGLELELDRLRPLMFCGVEFDRENVCATERVSMKLTLESFFPSEIKFSKIDVIFNEPQYNKSINTDAPGTKPSLSFLPETPKVLDLDLVLDHGTSYLNCIEVQLHLSIDVAAEAPAAVVFRIRAGRTDKISRRRNSLVTGEGAAVHVMAATDDKAFDSASSPVVNEFRTFVNVVQPSPSAEITLLESHSSLDLLVGDYRELFFNVSAIDATLTNPTLMLSCSMGEDNELQSPFFYKIRDKNGEYCSMEDTTTNTPRGSLHEAIRMKSIEPSCSEKCSVVVHSEMACNDVQVTALLTYTTSSEITVRLQRVFKLRCKNPFVETFEYLPAFLGSNIELTNSIVDSSLLNLPTGKTVAVQASLTCASDESLVIKKVFFEANDPALRINATVNSGGVDKVCKSEEYDVMVRLFPPKELTGPISFGSLVVSWHREDSSESSAVITYLPLPQVNLVTEPFTISLNAPTSGTVGSLMSIALSIRNNTRGLQPFKISLVRTPGFMIHGMTSSTEFAQPGSVVDSEFSVIPTTCGPLQLPNIEIVDLRTGNSILEGGLCVKEVFIMPH